MLLIQFVSEYQFKFIEIISNLMVFVVVACGTNLSDLFRKGNNTINEMPKIFTTFISIFILCFASILYCLLLLRNIVYIRVKEYILFLLPLY